MHRFIFIMLTTSLLASSSHSVAAAQEALESNAALKYWLAFSVLPRFEHDDELALGGKPGGPHAPNYRTAPLDAVTERMIARGETSLKMMHQATKLEHCAWGVNYQDGPFALLPQMAKSKELAGIACLRARMRIHQGDHAGGVQDVVAMLVLARHIGTDDTFVGILVQEVIERMATSVVADHLPELDRATLDALLATLDTLPEGGSPEQSILLEKKSMLGWFIDQVESIDPDGDWLAEANELFRATMGGDERLALKSDDGLNSPQDLARKLAELSDDYDGWSQAIQLPIDQFERESDQLSEQSASNRFAPAFGLTGGFKVLYETSTRRKVRMGMLRAAILLVRDGQQNIDEMADPFTSGSERFEYVESEDGFRLTSKMPAKGISGDGPRFSIDFGTSADRSDR